LIDLHCHILPGIDDGPDDPDTSLELARLLSEEGVRTVVATPHLRDDHPQVHPLELRARCDDLQAAVTAAGIDLTIVDGGEVDLLWALKATADDLALASYGQAGSWLLIETPNGPLSATLEQSLAEVSSRGYRVLLAHPERSPDFQRDPERLLQLTRDGVLLQVTVSTLGRPSRESRSARLAHHLLDLDAVHVLASDAHGPTGHRRAPGWAALAKVDLPSDRIDWMVEGVPAAILAGSPIPPAPPRPPRRGVFGRFRGKTG
jgi:protein-tyrosine phosphatase